MRAKTNAEVSWFEADPSLSLDLIKQVSPPPESVIDVGGGQSLRWTVYSIGERL